jgi:hypothetical protein
VDCNEACATAEPVAEYLRKLREASPPAYEALKFIEQPTGRELAGERLDVHAISKLKPLLLDEGLQSLPALPLAAELGWSGAALKTCKTHTTSLQAMAWCELRG